MRTKERSFASSLSEMIMGSDQATVMKRVIACTDELVELALEANWPAVLDGIDSRRRLLQTLVERESNALDPEVSALSAAVCESERALMRVVAHAIATSSLHGGPFAMYD